MLHALLADLIVLFHFAFVAFVIFGGFMVAYRPWVAGLHVPAFLWGALVELGGWICPLTPLENRYRMLAGEAGYAGGFIDRYLLPIIYPPGLTRSVQILIGCAVLVLNVGIYIWAIRQAKTGRRRGGSDP